ncbi:MAG: P-loop NTPase [Nitrospinae bacterium]|nr:P-loop NTPase [Nitrospinota bacterium]
MGNINELNILAIGGGKGGVGKSIISANIGFCLSQLGHKVVCLDADLGGANLHTLLGVKYPLVTLNDFFRKKVSHISDTLIETEFSNLYLISGANGILELANPKYAQKAKLINSLKTLEADYLILDLGAGSGYDVLDFFTMASGKIVVASPEPTSIQNVYGFLKIALVRALLRKFSYNKPLVELIKTSLHSSNASTSEKLMEELIEKATVLDNDVVRVFTETLNEFKVQLILNNISSENQKKTGTILETVADKFLSMRLMTAGSIHHDPYVSKSVIQMKPFMNLFPECQAARDIREIEEKLRMEFHGFHLKRNINAALRSIDPSMITHH